MDDSSSSSSEQELIQPEYFQESKEEKAFVASQKITSSRMTKYEKAHILGVRALQISMGATPLVDIEHEIDPLKIALKELNLRKIPFILRRNLPDSSFEEWDVNTMDIPND